MSDLLTGLRALRPAFFDGAAECRAAVLSPSDDLGLPAPLRLALACRMAALNADAAMGEDLQAELAATGPGPELLAVAAGTAPDALTQPWAAMARQVDLVTCRPREATPEDLSRLQASGLTVPQVVALAELVAYVNYQARIHAGLRLLGA